LTAKESLRVVQAYAAYVALVDPEPVTKVVAFGVAVVLAVLKGFLTTRTSRGSMPSSTSSKRLTGRAVSRCPIASAKGSDG
jgi:hypothetical protein